MAYSQEPDKQERYKRRDESMANGLVLVVKHYNDIPELVSWHIEDKNKDVYEADQCDLNEMSEIIKAEEWELIQ